MLHAMGLAVNDGLNGAGVTVALIDSGLYPSAAFAGRIQTFVDFTGGGARRDVPPTPTVTARMWPD